MTSFNKESSPLSGMEDKQKPENRLSFRQRIVPLPLPRYQHSLLLLRFSGVHLNVNIPLPLSRSLFPLFSLSLFYAKQFPYFVFHLKYTICHVLLFQVFFPPLRPGWGNLLGVPARKIKIWYEKGIMKIAGGCETRSS